MLQEAEQRLLEDLTAAQYEAVTHLDGPLLILAGPGSGKTRVITRRVAYLLYNGVDARRILAVTFTNKAASEMRQRIAHLLPRSEAVDGRGVEIPPHRFLRVCTFHSFGVYFLRRYADRLGFDRNFTIYDQDDRTRLVKAALDAADLDSSRFTPQRIEGAISRAKNELLTPPRYAATANDFFTQVVARVYPIYEKKLRMANAFDFDDLLLIPALALKNDEELRRELDDHFRYVLVDEYQDTNKAQYALARGLSRDYSNLCVVGDPDQSIYRWRGSDIRNILDFERDFPQARVITLDRNYRSTKAILNAAGHLIAHNRKRKPKGLITENPAGDPVGILCYQNGLDEADDIARRIREAAGKHGRRFRDFAIFLRMNALSRACETACIKHQVPYQIVRGLAFFDRKENKDILAYLRLLINPRDNLSFLRAVAEPSRGVGKTSLEHLQNYAVERDMSLLEASSAVDAIPAIRGKAAGGLRAFHKLIADLAGSLESPPADVIREVLEQSGYRRMLMNSSDPDDEERLANVEEMITAARQFTAEDESRTLADFLESITLSSDVDGWDENQDCVSIMTLHAAKGLEFPVVYMAAVEQGILPHERSMANADDLEEERRLAFVGMTRAKHELYLSYARQREFRGQSLYSIGSMFLDELPDQDVETFNLGSSAQDRPLPDDWLGEFEAKEAPAKPRPKLVNTPEGQEAQQRFIEGMLVRHHQYGQGRVVEVSGYGALRKVKVRFASAGERTFLVNKAKLSVVGS